MTFSIYFIFDIIMCVLLLYFYRGEDSEFLKEIYIISVLFSRHI